MASFISKDKWDSMVNEYPINVKVIITDENGIEYNKAFFMKEVNPVEFKEKMDACQESLIRTLMAKNPDGSNK